jgi:ribA/ribD-fused uncharacterized protein
MILPGTKYRINQELVQLGRNGAIGKSFDISLMTDPRSDEILIVTENSTEEILVPKSCIVDNCELITDFAAAIYFYTPQEPYGQFSNFYEHGITVDKYYYPTVEHFYQASKFENIEYKEQIRKCNSPKRASELGKTKNYPIRSDWDEYKIHIMIKALRLKFGKNTEFGSILLQTKDKLLIENSPYDNFWGIGKTGEGLNYLGTLLMRIRNEIS